MWTDEDIRYMKEALALAERGAGHVSPNPMVGAVIVKDGRIVSRGWHKACGALHAETDALACCSESPAGATMYVTLEPCCHYGKQPPCTTAIIEAGISRVVVAMADPNPLVAGKGISILREHGISVQTGLLEKEASALNRIFIRYITEHRPWVIMKSAMTLDGKIAARTGDSRWVSSEESRRYAHQLRAWNMAIMAGIGTVRVDDPLLNCRIDGMRSPVRVIADSYASVSLSSQVVRTAHQYRTVVAYSGTPDPSRLAALADAGVETVKVAGDGLKDNGPKGDGLEQDYMRRETDDIQKVDIDALLSCLGKMGIDSVLVEGGAELDWSMIESGLVDEVYCYIAPKVIGGSTAKGPVGGVGFPVMADAFALEIESVSRSGPDILVHAFPAHSELSF